MPLGVIYLLTINSAKRRPLFAAAAHARIVVETLTEYTARRGYGLLLCTVMPDHVHAVLAASDASSGLSQFLNNWKTWCTRRLREAGVEGDVWQNEFFDHRIRSEESLAEKCEYIVHNPVRARLEPIS